MQGKLSNRIRILRFHNGEMSQAELGQRIGLTRQTIAAIEAMGSSPDWLVVDHYALDSHWENALRTSVGRIMVIDDLADRRHDCDLLLDQNLVAEMQTRYDGKVPASCTKLLGPEYALLQPIYAELHDRIPPKKGPIRRIFIFFGGADSENITGRTLAAFLDLNRQDIEVDVVIAGSSTHAQSIRQQIAGKANIHLHTDLPTLAPLMAKSDLAIGAGGATSWERLCLGLYTVVITLAKHQCPVAMELGKLGLINWLGHKDEVSERAIRQTLSELLEARGPQFRQKPHPALSDGRGIERVCNHLYDNSRECGAVF